MLSLSLSPSPNMTQKTRLFITQPYNNSLIQALWNCFQLSKCFPRKTGGGGEEKSDRIFITIAFDPVRDAATSWQFVSRPRCQQILNRERARGKVIRRASVHQTSCHRGCLLRLCLSLSSAVDSFQSALSGRQTIRRGKQSCQPAREGGWEGARSGAKDSCRDTAGNLLWWKTGPFRLSRCRNTAERLSSEETVASLDDASVQTEENLRIKLFDSARFEEPGPSIIYLLN